MGTECSAENWAPTNNSFLCEVYFASEMWETGRKQKLKQDTIPTIFFVKKQISTRDIKNGSGNVHKITSNIQSECTNEEATDDVENEEIIINDTSKPTTSLANIVSLTESRESKEKENEKYKELVNKQQQCLIIMRKKIKALQFTNRMLKSKIDNNIYKKSLSVIFNEDQVRALLKKNHIRNWPNKTIQVL